MLKIGRTGRKRASTEYQYDNASRLTALIYRNALGLLGDLTYQYDQAGNRTRIGGSFARTLLPDPVPSATTYDAGNRLSTFSGQTLTHDLEGNLASDGTTTYSWDVRNRPVSLTAPGTTATFQYDYLGRRAQKNVNGNTTSFQYDGSNPIQELSGAAEVADILGGLEIDKFFTRTDSAGTRALLTDVLGSTLALTDPDGTLQTQYTYQPFGATAAIGPTSANSLQYTGRENDGAGLYYYRARYYHPRLHRFIAEDPIRLAGGQVNFYVYVTNSPLIYSDPFGLEKKKRRCDIFFLGVQARRFFGGLRIGPGGDIGSGNEVTVGLAFNPQTFTLKTFKSEGVASPDTPGDKVVGADLSVGVVFGQVIGSFSDFFGESTQDTFSAYAGAGGSLSFIETASGRPGIAVGPTFGPPLASVTTIKTKASPGRDILSGSGGACQ